MISPCVKLEENSQLSTPRYINWMMCLRSKSEQLKVNI